MLDHTSRAHIIHKRCLYLTLRLNLCSQMLPTWLLMATLILQSAVTWSNTWIIPATTLLLLLLLLFIRCSRFHQVQFPHNLFLLLTLSLTCFRFVSAIFNFSAIIWGATEVINCFDCSLFSRRSYQCDFVKTSSFDRSKTNFKTNSFFFCEIFFYVFFFLICFDILKLSIFSLLQIFYDQVWLQWRVSKENKARQKESSEKEIRDENSFFVAFFFICMWLVGGHKRFSILNGSGIKISRFRDEFQPRSNLILHSLLWVVGDCSRGWPESFFFNSYYNEV